MMHVVFQLVAVGDRYGFDGVGRFAHGGMLKAAIIIREELDVNNTLGKIYGTTFPTASSIIANNISVPLREVR